MNKLIKVEKKKAQWDKRQRALEEQVYKLQKLVKEQHTFIEVDRSQIFSLFDAIKHGDEQHQAWLKDKIESHFGIKVPSTTHSPYQSPSPQSSTSPISQGSIETTQESYPEQQTPQTHTDLDPEQST
jgi:hypothetical protein